MKIDKFRACEVVHKKFIRPIVRSDDPLQFFKAVLKEEVDHIGIWREMERLVDEGKLKSIGVSNFNSEQIERLNEAARIPIAVNQVECSPYFQQRKLRAAMDKLGIRMMAYASLGSTGDGGVHRSS